MRFLTTDFATVISVTYLKKASQLFLVCMCIFIYYFD